MRICLACEGVTPDALEHCGNCGVVLVEAEGVHFPRRSGERDATHPLIGTSVAGKYEVVGVLGRGGMGMVYRAQHEVSQVPVALKVLHPRFAGRKEYRQAFLAEARKAGRVVHEHSARILDVGQSEDGAVYIAMELVEGETLSQWIHRQPRPSAAEVVEVMVQIGRALAAAHEAGVVHRDLSSNNVLVQVRDGGLWVKVLDFGISRSAALEVRRAGGGELATAASPEGYANPAYSAPEHLAGAPEDARADLYSLGVIAYEALAGRLPVDGESGREVAAATVRGEVRPMPGRLKAPARLLRLVERLLATDPELRPGSAAEVVAALEAMRKPRSVVAQVVAAVALAGALAVWVSGLFDQRGPTLQSRIGSAVAIRTVPRAAGASWPVIPVDALDRWELEVSGWGVSDLSVEIVQAGNSLGVLPLDPERDAEGWVLNRRQGAWQTALQRIRSASPDGPVDLRFGLPGRPSLGFARVQLDGDVPELLWADTGGEASVGGDGPLRAGVSRSLLVSEQIGLASLRLVLSPAGGDGGAAGLAVVDLLPLAERVAFGAGQSGWPTVRLDLDLPEMLGDTLQGFGDQGPVELTVFATDRAGNEGRSATLRFSASDIRIPEIEAVGATAALGAAITWSGARAQLAVVPSEWEEGLQVMVAPPDGRERVADRARRLGNALEVTLSAAPDGNPFPDGEYRFALVDRVGNRSGWFTRTLSFLDRAPDVSVLEPTSGVGTRRGELLFTDGGSTVFPIQCDPAFRLSVAGDGRLDRSDGSGGWVPGGSCQLVDGRAGERALALPALPMGRYRIRLSIEDTTRDDPDRDQPLELTLLVLPSAPVLRVPEVLPHLPAALDAGLLVRGDEPNDLWVPAGVFQLEPRMPEAVRATLWVGRGGLIGGRQQVVQEWAREPIPLAAGDARMRVALKPGRTVLAVAATDVLGRPLAVQSASGPAPMLGRGAAEPSLRWVAEWFWDDPLVMPGEPSLRIEYGQPVRLELRSPLPWVQLEVAKACRLRVASTVLEPDSIREDEQGGCVLTWRLPFDAVATAAEIGDWTQDRFGQEEGLWIPVTFLCADGQQELILPARTSRSLLSAWSLAGLFPERSGTAALQDLVMVPVLGPDGPVPDPVPAVTPARNRFRAEPELQVRNLTTVYLQDRELTRAQYAEIVSAGEQGGLAGLAAHEFDPLGDRRMTAAGLMPGAFRGDPAAFQAWVDAGPKRPVSGVDWFQAWTAARAVGLLLADDPELFRLPTGRELEWASCGGQRRAPHWHGMTDPSVAVLRAAVEQARPEDPGAWPLTAKESAQLGDVVRTERSEALHGLDLGLREWVLDLQFPSSSTDMALLREWLTDHQRHLERIMALARGELAPPALASDLARMGVVRGLAVGESVGWVDGWSGEVLWGDESAGPGRVSRLPGVVRSEYLRRDGGGPVPGEMDPRLRWIGFRLCGGDRFIAEVRSRG